jgi:RNA 3'-terminal phosphate cyclase (ATP)
MLGWSGDQLRAPAVRKNEGPGNALMATLEFQQLTEVFTSFGEKGVSAEQVADTLARQVRAFLTCNGAMGPHLADQWMLPLALAVAATRVSALYTCSEMSEHSKTNIGVIEKFLPVRFSVESLEAAWRVSVAAEA